MKQQLQQSRAWWHAYVPAAFLTFVTALVYYPSLRYPFQFDDLANITKHFNIRHYRLDQLFFSGTRWISYWLNSLHYKMSKFDSLSYRVGNVCIHTVNGLLVFSIFYLGLTRLRTDSFFKRNALLIATLSGLLFLLHPVQTQTVSYVIQGELEGMATLATLLMVMCFLWSKNTLIFGQKFIANILLFVCAILACGTKEITIVSPFLVALVDWFFVAQGSWKRFKTRIWLHSLIFLLMFGSYLYLMKPEFFSRIFGLRYEVKNNIGNVITNNPTDIITPYIFFISQFKVILHYLFMFIWPFNISVEYDWMLCNGFFAVDCLVPLALLIMGAAAVVTLLARSSSNPLCFGVLWFVVAIAPRSTIMPSPELLVDYKTYLGSVGWLFVLACGLCALIEIAMKNAYRLLGSNPRNNAFINGALIMLIAVPLGVGTYNRNMVWRSGLEFWGNIIERAPGKARAYNNYGVELSQHQNKFAEAIPYFQKAIDMDQHYADPCNNIAVAYSQTGQVDRAIEALRRGLTINPYYPEGYNNIASFYMQKRELETAKKALAMALKLRPHYGKAHFNMGRIYLDEGNNELAWQHFKKCCTEADLDHDELGFSAYGKTSLMLYKFEDAEYAYRRLLELNPNSVEGIANIGVAYVGLKQYEKAIGYLQKASTHLPQDVHIQLLLSEAFLSLNRLYEAHDLLIVLKNRGVQHPQLYLRLAACHEKLGDPRAAKAILCELLEKNFSPDINEKTQICIAKIDEQYKLS